MMKWIKAFRLRTLPLAFSGWMVGISIAAREVTISYGIALLTLLTAFLLQIVSNLANDYGDASSGVDAHRKGEQRMVNSGQISSQAMKRAMILSSLLAFVSGIILLFLAFPDDWKTALVFLCLGLVGIAAAIKYTVGKNPYGYAGFGDVFVFVFFGLVLVFGTFYLQTISLDFAVLLPASSIGLLSVGVLNVNNIRDIESDKLAGKNSIPVRIGRKNAVRYHVFLLISAVFASTLYVLLSYQSSLDFIQLLFLLSCVFLVKNLHAVSSLGSEELDPFLKQMAISTLLFSVFFAIGQAANMFFN